MNDVAFHELLVGFEVALEATKRSLTIARALAEAYRSGVRPPDVILDAYFATVDRDDARLQNALKVESS